jgi:NAD(P)-dependent dehydrogenase (short-subunit alcohol dehydrogenase family)
MEISGKKAIIVGGASGMGRASAELLAARGASVAILDRSSSDGKAVTDNVPFYRAGGQLVAVLTIYAGR